MKNSFLMFFPVQTINVGTGSYCNLCKAIVKLCMSNCALFQMSPQQRG